MLPEDLRLSEEEIEQQIGQLYIDLIRNEVETLTSTVEIKLVRENKSWKITLDEELQDAIC